MSSELGRRVAFTLGALLVFRLGSYIPIPGINIDVWQKLFFAQEGGFLGMANLMSGGALHSLSIFSLNITPYMTAAIAVQMFLLVSSKGAALRRRGERGRGAVIRYTLGLAVLFAAFQALGLASGLEEFGELVNEPGLWFRVSAVASFTGGTVFLVWLCELINLWGIGNGLALVLFVGVVTQVPSSMAAVLDYGRQGVFESNVMLVLAVLFIGMIGCIVAMELARRLVPVEFSIRRTATHTRTSNLSLKLNNAGIIPVVVATWFLSIVIVVADLAGGFNEAWVTSVARNFGRGTPGFMIATTIVVVICAFLYTAFVVDPDDAAERLEAYGGIIPGVAPGEATAAHVGFVVSRSTVLGAAYLALIALIPELVVAYTKVPIYFGGISALIVVCVVLDVMAQVREDRPATTGG